MALSIEFSWGIRSIDIEPPRYKMGEVLSYEKKEQCVDSYYVELSGPVNSNFRTKLDLYADKLIQNSDRLCLFISPGNIRKFLNFLLTSAETDLECYLTFKPQNIEYLLNKMETQNLVSKEKTEEFAKRSKALSDVRRDLIAKRAEEQQIADLKHILSNELNLYINSRGSVDSKFNIVLNWITRTFRNSELSKEKIMLATNASNQIQRAKTVKDFETIVSILDEGHTSVEKNFKKNYGFFSKSHFKESIDNMSAAIKNYNGMQLSPAIQSSCCA